MNLPKQELLRACKDPLRMESLIIQADKVLKTWQPSWSPFISAPLREEAMQLMASLNEVHWYSDGGYPSAERHRMLCVRSGDETALTPTRAPIQGIQIEGNFLFDQASQKDIRDALQEIGLHEEQIGDIWILNDRGAQALCTPEAASFVDSKNAMVRDVNIICESIQIEQVRLPIQRALRRFNSVEASTRIDAIASAGFGLSRAKIVKQIKEGRLRLNWSPIKQASKDLRIGDRIHLEGKGTLEVLDIEPTKRQRWRVELQRS